MYIVRSEDTEEESALKENRREKPTRKEAPSPGPMSYMQEMITIRGVKA